MSLAVLMNAAPQEELDERDYGAAPAAASEVDAAQAASVAPAAPIKMGLVGLNNSTASADLDDDGDLGNLGDVLEVEEPVAAKTVGSVSIEDRISAAMPSEPAFSTDVANDDVAVDSAAPGDEPAADAAGTAEGVETAPEAVETLTGNRYDATNPDILVLTQMLQLQRGEVEAQEMAIEFLNGCEENERENKKLDLDEKELRERLEAANEETVQQVGGGFLSSLLNRVVPKPGDAKRDIEGIGRARRRQQEQYTGHFDAMRSRMASNISRDLDKRILRSHGCMTDAARAVNDYNAVALGSDAAKEVRKAAEAFAAASGLSLAEVASQIGSRKAPKDILDAFDAAQQEIAADEGVKKAKAAMQQAQNKLGDEVRGVKDRIDVLLKNGDQTIPEKQDVFMKGIADHIEKSPTPMQDPEEAEEFKKRLREMFESIREAIDAFLNKLLGGLSR